MEGEIGTEPEKGMERQIMDDTLRSLKYAYYIKTAISVIGGLIKMLTTKQIPNIFYLLINKSTIQFCLFMGSLTFLKKTILFLLKKHYKTSNRKMAFISGFLAGFLSLLFIDKNSRRSYALFMIGRTLDSVFNSLQNRDIIKTRSYYYVIIFAIIQIVHTHAYFFEKECLAVDFDKEFSRFQNFTPRDLSVLDAFSKIYNRQQKVL